MRLKMPKKATSFRNVWTFLKTIKPPAILYHYTSIQGFAGIVKESCIWATDTRYLNDQTELKNASCFVKNQVLEEIRKYPEHEPNFEEEWQALRLVISWRNETTFVASFSEDGDDLDQWRGYCPNGLGFSIGLDPQLINELKLESRNHVDTDTDDAPSQDLLPCVYDEQRKKLLVREAIEQYTQSLIADKEEDGHYLKLSNLRWHVERCAPLFKDKAFEGEHEWRVVIAGSSFLLARQFRLGGSMLIPYLKLNFGCVKKHLIRNVFVGPTPNPELSRESAQALLAVNGYEAPVTNSSIPYRNW